MVTILKYNKITTDYDIYIRLFSDVTVSYLTVYTDNVIHINNNSNDTAFLEIRKVFEESFDIKFQEVYVPKYLDFLIDKSPLGFIIDNNDHTMDMMNKWFLTIRQP